MLRTPLVTRLLLAGALVLPAVVTRAEAGAPPPAADTADGAMCSVAPDLGGDRGDLLAKLQARLLEEQARSGEDVVVLNGRGYRYDDAPSIARDLRVLEAEIVRARARAKQGANPAE